LPADTGCAEQPETDDGPSLNATVPVGVPAPGAVTDTVAVYVTDCPVTDGFTEDTTPVDVKA
jgi:hypothetical protein